MMYILFMYIFSDDVMKNECAGFPNQHLPQKAPAFLLFLSWLGVGSGLHTQSCRVRCC